MAESDETAFLASLKAANEENGVYEEANGGVAATESINTSDEYDPAQAVPTVPSFHPIAQESSTHQIPSSALLNETMSTSTLPEVSSVAVPTIQDRSGTNGSDRQSESRSMSRATSSDASPTLVPDQSSSDPSLVQRKGTATNGDKTVPTLPKPSSTLPTTSLDSTAVTPTPVAEHPSVSSMQNGDHVTANDSASPTSKRITSVDGKLADSAMTAKNDSDTTTAPALSKESTAPTPSLPKARLPHDTIGILEDRTKEDPRGDMDAWLSLVGEYRKRGKLDEARNVYERFFAVFPAAVRLHPNRL